MIITPDQLKSTLELKFKVMCFVDLAEINQSVSTIYKIFKDYHKEKFDPTDRLVFYSNHIPSIQLIDHICLAADIIDISRCFIMICCPDMSINNTAGIEYFQTVVTAQPLLTDNIAISSSMCPLPWMHLAVMNLGEVKPCCVSNDVIGCIPDQKLTEIFNNAEMLALRDSLSAGKKPPGCSSCWELESQNLESYRQWHLRQYKKQLYSGWVNDPVIRSIDFRPSNICNFKCMLII